MFRIVEVQGVPLTPELVQAHNALDGLPGEREAKSQRLRFLRSLLSKGVFQGVVWAWGICLANRVTYRLDGQHTGLLLGELEPSEFPEGQTATIIKWEFDTLDDAADLFNMFNNPRSARTNEDVMGVYRASVTALQGLSRRFLVNVAKGVHMRETQKWEDDDDAALGPYGPREQGIYFHFDGPVAAAVWLAMYQNTQNAAFLGHAPIVAEMIRQWEVNPDLAGTFWNYVLRENHPDPEHETRKLALTFRDWTKTKRTRAPQYRAKAMKAWKEFTKGQIVVPMADNDTDTDAPDDTPDTSDDQPAA